MLKSQKRVVYFPLKAQALPQHFVSMQAPSSRLASTLQDQPVCLGLRDRERKYTILFYLRHCSQQASSCSFKS